MTRKDYVIIARAINAQVHVTYLLPTLQKIRTQALTDVATQMCVQLLNDNPRFNSGTFMKACGL